MTGGCGSGGAVGGEPRQEAFYNGGGGLEHGEVGWLRMAVAGGGGLRAGRIALPWL